MVVLVTENPRPGFRTLSRFPFDNMQISLHIRCAFRGVTFKEGELFVNSDQKVHILPVRKPQIISDLTSDCSTNMRWRGEDPNYSKHGGKASVYHCQILTIGRPTGTGRRHRRSNQETWTTTQ